MESSILYNVALSLLITVTETTRLVMKHIFVFVIGFVSCFGTGQLVRIAKPVARSAARSIVNKEVPNDDESMMSDYEKYTDAMTQKSRLIQLLVNWQKDFK